jgi:hypothetical protein
MMKKYLFLSASALVTSLSLWAQTNKTRYPEPEFSNEIYLLKKDSSLVRLEKDASRMDTKMKMGGFGGMENGYPIEGEKSPVRLASGDGLSFVFSTGATAIKSTAASDSMMKANGMDASMISAMRGDMSDPANSISLYKAEASKGTRKILLQKSGGMFSAGKSSSSKKYTFSAKKIRDGYWELVIDKTLPQGEYAFTIMGMGMGSMDGSVSIFAFAID